MKTIASAMALFIATILVVLGICEISFPDVFSWTEVLSAQFPKLYRYAVWIGVGECVAGFALIIPAWYWNSEFTSKTLETLFRIGLGGMFITASLFKIHDPKGFAVLVAQYQMLPHELINLFAVVMPCAEFLFGLALIVTPFTRENASIIFLMFISFIVALTSALWRDLGITCGCFAIEGAQDRGETWTSLIRDLVLIWPTLWLARRPNRSLWRLWMS
ncbi:MAG TPA: MauE/DoxX family redox-associated membrane protein [Fibrobacteraceae bacterium]|nr:MauE/DoxX family redox-associated membrane protein [Fibrobacteraceae bacterium]